MALSADVPTTPSIRFACERGTGELKHIREVKTGLHCNCVCPCCRRPLEAVNAEADQFIVRPHFRHLHGQTLAACINGALAIAIQTALAEARALKLPPRSATRPRFPGAADPPGETIEFRQFELVDATFARLHLVDGSVLDVLIEARERRRAKVDREHDLVLHLPPATYDDLPSLAALRAHLTADPNAWRWAARAEVVPPPRPGYREPSPSESAERIDAEGRPDAAGGAAPAGQPRDDPTVFIRRPDGRYLLLIRQRWPSGIQTEEQEIVSAADPRVLRHLESGGR